MREITHGDFDRANVNATPDLTPGLRRIRLIMGSRGGS